VEGEEEEDEDGEGNEDGSSDDDDDEVSQDATGNSACFGLVCRVRVERVARQICNIILPVK
jgi:hypothetical protein